MWSFIFGTFLLFAPLVQAREPGPILLSSGGWTGSDGNWSSISFSIGSDSQQIELLVSTALSEIWAVGPGGCLPKEPHCTAARGGVYNPQESRDWSSLGIWQLGLSYLGYGGNGDYGRDLFTMQSPLSDKPYNMDDVLIATINSTSYLNGLFGLGITQGNFNGTVADSPLTQAVEQYGLIPSYSFGYTAGAHYRNTPVSLTLGGVEPSRYQEHDNVFTLTQDDNLERPLVRGIEIMPFEGRKAPNSWESPQLLLSQWNSSFYALIDSTTPYLWLTFDLYTLTNDQYRAYTKDDSFNLTFVLSSFDDNDNFGDPYDVSGVVNITLPLKAFVGLLQYPFMQDTIEYGDPAIPYFMLRKAQDSEAFILGRSFLQESYLITKYDEGTFSVHQALFPDESPGDSGLSAIKQSDNSPYPPPKATDSEQGLSETQVIGIAVGVGVGVFALCATALAGWLCFRRRRKSAARNNNLSAGDQDSSTTIAPQSPKSPLALLFSKVFGRSDSTQRAGGVTGGGEKAVEAPDTQIHEMLAPIPPAELDADDGISWNDDTELGTDNSNNISAYEMARKKIERQLQGPVPTYTPRADGTEIPPEKAIYQPDPTNGPPIALQLSPSASLRTTQEGNSNSNSIPLPSPMTPRFDTSGRPINTSYPSIGMMPASPTNEDSDLSPNSPLSLDSDHYTINSMAINRSHSDRQPHSPTKVTSDVPQRTVQRTPIDPSKVVFLGALPKDTRFSRHGEPNTELHQDSTAPGESSRRRGTLDTLGSNFTVDEERESSEGSSRRLGLHTNESYTEAAREDPHQYSIPDPPDTSRSQERINPCEDLVHVPQMAERRYSWE
ncbi:hypothetical protein FGRMN_11162 [Fusarium graminum]|nr:hypothetical protein FGRMN_11162 [Fusarium graminum]